MQHHPTPVGAPASPDPADMTAVERAIVEARRDALSPREVALRTGLSYHAVLREIHRGALHAKQVCDGSRILIPIAAYRAWLEPSEIEAAQAAAVKPRRRRTTPKASAAQSGSFERLLALEDGSAA